MGLKPRVKPNNKEGEMADKKDKAPTEEVKACKKCNNQTYHYNGVCQKCSPSYK